MNATIVETKHTLLASTVCLKWTMKLNQSSPTCTNVNLEVSG